MATQSADLLDEFDIEDLIIAEKSSFKRLNSEQLGVWLTGEYSLGDKWKKNLLGGRVVL